MDERITEVLKFWFEPATEDEERPSGEELWFEKSVKVERLIEKRFGKLVVAAKAGDLDGWAETPEGRLALIIVLDQFNRRIHRETPEMFTGDAKALALCFDGLDDGVDRRLSAPQRLFFYMPCMNAEDVDAQLASVEVYAELVVEAPPAHKAMCESFLKRAEAQRDVVERFERFPHRNDVLDRSSTQEESMFLQHSGHF